QVSVLDRDGYGTTTTAAGTTVSNAAGASSTIGAGTIDVTDANGTTLIAGNQVSVGGASPIVISGDTGTIGGLTNTTFDPDSFTSGQAATEDQLKSVSDVANAGWNVSDGTSTHNIGPDGKVTFVGDSNLTVTESGADDDAQIQVALNKDVDLGADGSVTTGNSVLNNDGLAIDDGAGNITNVTTAGTTVTDAAGASSTIGAGTIDVTDANGT